MTGLLETSSLFKVFECFSVFVALVIHRIGNRGSQVGGGGLGVGLGLGQGGQGVGQGVGPGVGQGVKQGLWQGVGGV